MLGDDDIRLFDFGLGQAREGFLKGLPRLACSRFAAWTPRYAAPELLDGATLNAAADVYAVACVIYELCSGQHPFRRQSAKQAQAMELPLTAPRTCPAHCGRPCAPRWNSTRPSAVACPICCVPSAPSARARRC